MEVHDALLPNRSVRIGFSLPPVARVAGPPTGRPSRPWFSMARARCGACRCHNRDDPSAWRQRWPAVNGADWLPAGASYRRVARPGSAGSQLWRLDPASGEGTAITRDLFNYPDVGASADGGSIVAVATLNESTLWTAEADRGPSDASDQRGRGRRGHRGCGVEDGSEPVYTSRTSGNQDLWSLDPKTGARRQLTSDQADDAQPALSPDGRLIAFISSRGGGQRIWLMNVDGTEPRPISAGPTDTHPAWSPDGSSIIFVGAI